MTSGTRGVRLGATVGLLMVAMGAATLAPGAIGIVATFIIDDLSISRATLGWIASTNVLIAAALSPVAGSLTDRVGGKAALVGVFLASSAAFAVFGVAPGLVVMFVGSSIAAFAQAGGNPATNTVIRDMLDPGRRGVVTGLKQSGVQITIAVAGLTLPAIAIAYGWRTSMLAVGVGVLLAGVASMFVVEGSTPTGSRAAGWRGVLPSSTWWLAAFGCTFGFAGSIAFFVALYAEESVGLDPRVGGAIVGFTGIVAFVARVVWARFAEVRHAYRGPLATMASLGAVAGAAMALASVAPWLVWVGAALTGVSTSAWNSVGMLAVIDEAGEATGRASGIVLLGFLAGLGLGPPIYGAAIDRFGSYTLAWTLSIAASLISVVIVAGWHRRSAGAANVRATA